MAFAAARAAASATIGLGIDETYTVVVSRHLQLSYFDHPPLHQWIAHFGAAAFGEGAGARAPFIALFAATGWLLFTLTRRLFGSRAGLVALVALNVSPFFFLSAGGWVVPDGPLLFALAGLGNCAVALFLEDRSPSLARWLMLGAWIGLAGLSKYSAALSALGLAIFALSTPRGRSALTTPGPYLAILIAVAVVAPVFIWNAENDWVSFAFQGGRGAPSGRLRFDQVGAMAAGEAAFLAPWLAVPLVAGLVAAMRRAGDDPRARFLLALALPPILVFTITPLWSARGLPHWAMPGWFFAFPLAAAWATRRYDNLTRAGIVSAALMALVALLLWAQAAFGLWTRLLPTPENMIDPTIELLGWDALSISPVFRTHPDAPVFAAKWSDGGKIALALGRTRPVVVASQDPRGMAFLGGSEPYVGKDVLIVAPEDRMSATLDRLRPYFQTVDAPETVSVERGGREALRLVVVFAHSLTRPYKLPYPRSQ